MNVTIIGAGASGLACAAELARKGAGVRVVEGRDRIGGRIWTVHSPHTDAPIDLGAEFVHGRPPEISALMQPSELYEGDGEEWCSEEGRLFRCDFFDKIMKVLERMEPGPRDRGFLDFLNSVPASEADQALRLRILEYISGFNAADPRQISVRSLIADQKAQDAIEGDRIIRVKAGYAKVIERLYSDCEQVGVQFSQGCAVIKVDWGSSPVRLHCRGASGLSMLEADKAVSTIPIGVLQGGQVEFSPALPEGHRQAIEGIEVGPVIRVVLIFKERFWAGLKGEDGGSLEKMNFLFSHDPCFPTWWSRYPDTSAVLVAWAAASRAEQMMRLPTDELITQALTSLASILHVSRPMVEEQLAFAHTHDWQSDPYSRGAYSYFKVGASDAPERLIQPLAGRLFFSGEATNTKGHHGTVHGAIAAGVEAAGRVLAS